MSAEFLVRDSRQPGHFWADNEVLDIYGPKLGAHGFAVYMALCRNATNGTGECRMATRKLAKLLDISAGGAFNALALIVKLGLIQQASAGDPRNPATYLLADVKNLTSVHGVNAKNIASVHPVNARAHGMNAAFTPRTPNKERKTSYKTYKTKSQGSKGGKDISELVSKRNEQERRDGIARARARGLIVSEDGRSCHAPSRPV